MDFKLEYFLSRLILSIQLSGLVSFLVTIIYALLLYVISLYADNILILDNLKGVPEKVFFTVFLILTIISIFISICRVMQDLGIFYSKTRRINIFFDNLLSL